MLLEPRPLQTSRHRSTVPGGRATLLLGLLTAPAQRATASASPLNASQPNIKFGRHFPPLSAVLQMARAMKPECASSGTAIDVGARGAEETVEMLTANFSTISIECQAEEYIRIYELLRYDPKLTLLHLCASNHERGPSIVNVFNAEGATTLERSALNRWGEMQRHRASKRKTEPVLSMPLDILVWRHAEPNSGIEHPVCVIKVDVQGHELPVLEGFTETLRRYKPVIYWEFELRLGLTAFGPLPFLESLGYTCVPNERFKHPKGIMPCREGICDLTCSSDWSAEQMTGFLTEWVRVNGPNKKIAPQYQHTRTSSGRTATQEEKAHLQEERRKKSVA